MRDHLEQQLTDTDGSEVGPREYGCSDSWMQVPSVDFESASNFGLSQITRESSDPLMGTSEEDLSEGDAWEAISGDMFAMLAQQVKGCSASRQLTNFVVD